MGGTHVSRTRAATSALPTSAERALHRTLFDTSEATKRLGSPRRDTRDEAEAAAAAVQGRTPSFDFSNIRIHADDEADALTRDFAAAAFTRGRDIYFRQGAWAPGTPAGDRLLAHELMHVQQQERSGQVAVQCSPETEVQAQLDRPVGADDTKAQAKRIAELSSMLNALSFSEATALLKRLSQRAPGDKLAEAFHHRLSTRSREALLGILQRRAVALPYSHHANPEDDPKYIDKLIAEVDSSIMFNENFGLIWKGGKQTIVYTEVDWKGGSHALPLVDVYPDRNKAMAAAKEWSDALTKGYDTVVAYYRGEGGAILPTWFSKETAPETYDLIRGVRKAVVADAQAAYQFFKGMRNGMIVGAVLGGTLRGAPRLFGGGTPNVPTGSIGDEPVPGASPRAPIVDPPTAPKVDPAPTVKGQGAPNVPDAPATGTKAPPVSTDAPVADPVRTDPAATTTDSAATKAGERAPGQGKAAGKAQDGAKAAKEPAVTAPFRACFVAGTRVATPAGLVAIEALRAGHEVTARPDGGELGAYPIAQVLAGYSSQLMEIQIAGATVRCTANHHFSVPARGWIPASDLRVGDVLATLSGQPRSVERVEALHPETTAAATFDICVPLAHSYFVVVGPDAVRVHNVKLTDPQFSETLYWLFGKKPNLRATDTDGLSVWRTKSPEDVRTFLETRVQVDGRPPTDPHGYYTEAQLKSAGLVAPETPAAPGASLAGKLPHHSLRPASAAEYPAPLTSGEMETLRGTLGGEGAAPTVIKPRQVEC